jgi:hypothetical protein
MAKIINRGKETLMVGDLVLGHGQHDVPDFDELAKRFPSLSSLVELVEPDAPKQPPKEPEEQPKPAPKKAEK